MNIADKQIASQIEGRTAVNVIYQVDDSIFNTDFISLYEQEGLAWIKPAFEREKQLSLELLGELRGLFTNEQQFCTDPEIIRWTGTRESFRQRFIKD